MAGYAKKLEAAAKKIVPVLKKQSVEDRYLKFDGTTDVPTRFFVPTQAGTKFQAEQALGDWAEDTLRDGINKSNAGVKAMSFGYNSKIMAEDENFKEEYKAGIVDTATYGKRADLLLYKSTETNLPADLTALDSKAVKKYIPACIGALEVRSSRLDVQKYVTYQKARKEEGKKPTSMEPNFTVKVEDLQKVFLWIHQNDKPQAYVQVFFDEIHAIGFLEVVEYIAEADKLRVEKHDRSAKTTIMVPISNGHLVGKVSKPPDFSVTHNVTKSGRHDIFACPSGGSIHVDVPKLLEVLK